MKLNFPARFLFTTTAFAPVSLVYAIVWYIHESYIGMYVCIVFGILLGVSAFGIAKYAVRKLPPLRYTATQVEAADSEIIGFIIVYLLPLMTDEYSTENWWAWLTIAVVLCWLVAACYGYHFNPVMTLFGWHFFKTTDHHGRTSVLITKNKLYEPNAPLLVGKIAEYVLIEKDRDLT